MCAKPQRLENLIIQHKDVVVSKKELKKLVESGFIPGIYNFCDRWCEKCTQQANCLSYAMGKKMEEKLGMAPEEGMACKNENIWAYLKNIFDSTYEILHDLALERGIEMEDIYSSEDLDKGLWADEYEHAAKEEESNDYIVATSDIIKICCIYESLSEDCLESVFAVLDEKEWAPEAPEEKESSEALDMINWYLDLIQSKIRRALFGYLQNKGTVDDSLVCEDYNGSAKVALIGIEQSEKAWDILKKYCPSLVKDISHIQVTLSQLTTDIETKFPAARKFKRPGFDS